MQIREDAAADASSLVALADFARTSLVKHKAPKHVGSLNALPTSDSGDVLKCALRESESNEA